MSLKLHNLTAPWRAVFYFFNWLKANPAAIVVGTFLMISAESFGQVNNEYRSVTSGLWNDRTTWERWNGATWQTPSAVQGPPNSSKNIITVRSPHIVTLDATVSADQFTIDAGAQLVVNAAGSFTIANGAAADMTVNGILDFSGNITKSTGAIIFINGEVINRSGNFIVMGTGALLFNANSIYRHLRNAGSIPNASWHATSTCEVAGILAGGITGLGQNFGNFIWNRVGQINNQDLPNLGTMSIAGNFAINSTGTGRLHLNQPFLNVGGNFTFSAGEFRLANADNDRTLTVNGNVSVTTNDTLRLAAGGAGAMGVGTMEVKGNFSAIGTTITETSLGNGYGNILFNGSLAQTITAAAAISESINVNLNNPAGALLASDFTIPGDLTLTSGLLSLGAFDLEVNGTLSGGDASKYVQTNGDGSLRLTGGSNVLYPVGNSTYNPATLNNTGSADRFSVRVSDQVLSEGSSGSPVMEKVVNRTWFIEELIPGGSNLDITLQWNAGDQAPDFTPDQSYIAHFTGSEWVGSGEADGSSYSLTFFGVTSLSPFSIGSQGALPVELVAFSAKPKGKQVQLDWRTASELNNAYFSIERSADGRSFSEIHKIPGAGTSQTPLDYTFTDQFPLSGWNYYRLRQEDTDGQFAYSPVEAVQMDQTRDAAPLQVFPNPAGAVLNLKTDRLIAEGDCLEIFDHTGHLAQRFSASDIVNAPMDISQLPAGTYIVRLRTAEGMVNVSFLKQ